MIHEDDYHPSIPLNDQIHDYLCVRPNTTAGIAMAFSIGFEAARSRTAELHCAGRIEMQDGLWVGRKGK